MNSTPFPSFTQSLSNSSNKPLISSFHSHPLLKFNNTHFKIAQIPIRPSTKASASAANGSYIPATDKETLYDLLGISETGTISEIKKAYKQMALKYHPDVSPPDRTEEYTVRFIQVREAYETLSDPEARSMYDMSVANGLPSAFSGKRGTRSDPGSDAKRRWKETWEGQISELMRRSRVKPQKVDTAGGMSWAARIRKQRSTSCVNGSDQDQ
ncbi:DnaJ domain-containing protein [Cynara cardunculus var. scolymus]|uniref:DnaJ domain-containing protein n=2 Tax=Cynara cardunculus var. scolymus TaxID=59895 RepID=A0A103YNC9_CYNCS|nr:DnaJ domain-containing protein [Cynara cardunculus var. scolymus]